MPPTRELFCRMMRFNLQAGFPLLTTKKMFTRGVIAELIWFLNGDNNLSYLKEQNVHIWDKDAYKFYQRRGGTLSFDDWYAKIPTEFDNVEQTYKQEFDSETDVPFGYCGNIYGVQWRDFGDGFDQIENVLKSLKHHPDSRYHIVTAWDPNDFLGDSFGACLPACHILFQFSVRDGKYLDLMLLQRSCDTFLGVPFNIASYALLDHLIAAEVGLEPGEFIWVGNSVHLYENHLDAVATQLERNPRPLPTLKFTPKPLFDEYGRCSYSPSDFLFENYDPHPQIKAELSVGV